MRWPVIGAPPGTSAATNADAADAADPLVPAELTALPVPLLSGVPWVVSEAPFAAMNAAVLVAPGGAVLHHYGKQHLVPFAESVPFWEVPAVRRLFRDVIGLQATWVAGAAATIFELPGAHRRRGAVRHPDLLRGCLPLPEPPLSSARAPTC